MIFIPIRKETPILIKGLSVTKGQKAVYDVLDTYGPLPDHALVPLTQHVAKQHQTSSSIRSRRAELQDRGLVAQTGETTTASGRRAGIFEVIR